MICASRIEKSGKSKEEHMQYNHVLDNKTDALLENQRASRSEAASDKKDSSKSLGMQS